MSRDPASSSRHKAVSELTSEARIRADAALERSSSTELLREIEKILARGVQRTPHREVGALLDALGAHLRSRLRDP